MSGLGLTQVRKGWTRSLTLDRVIAARRTLYQEAVICESSHFGKILVLDGIAQSSELDEHIYHEVLVHPAMCLHQDPRSILVLGGGEGATLREVLRHRTVDRVVMVDIDSELVQFIRLHWPSVSNGAFDHPKVTLRTADGWQYMATATEKYDVIIFDLTDPLPNGPAERMFTAEAFNLARECLSDEGVVAVQAGAAELGRCDEHLSILESLGSIFDHVISLYAVVPLYGSLYGFAIGAMRPVAAEPTAIADRLEDGQVQGLQYVDRQVLPGLLAVPRYIRHHSRLR